MNVIVTGASNGIGFELALQLIRKDGIKVLALSRNENKLLKLKIRADKINPEALQVLSFDLAGFNKEILLQELKKIKLTSVDILINNAGRLINKAFKDLTDREWLDIYNVNLFAPVKTIQTVLPLMKKGTHIVNISSFGGFQGSAKFPGLSAYSSSKAALINLTECLAEEFKDRQISVNCLALGAVQTEMLSKAFPGYKAPLSSRDMAKFICDFALNGNKYFNGKVLPVTLSSI